MDNRAGDPALPFVGYQKLAHAVSEYQSDANKNALSRSRKRH
jgi:hypothetical protein